MSFIKFESAIEKEKLREELRNAREELLKKAKKDAETRAEYEVAKKLQGQDTWIHPNVNKKITKIMKEHKKSKSKKHKKKDIKKHSKKSSKKKKKQKYSSNSDSSSSDDSSSSAEEKISKKKKKKQKKSSSESDSSNSSVSDEWVEKTSIKESCEKQKIEFKNSDKNFQRDSWMTEGSLLLKTYAKDDNTLNERKDKNKIDSYDPSKSSRELNPHWKDGGKGLPSFRKPKDDDDDDDDNYGGNYKNYRKSDFFFEHKRSSGNWRKPNSTTTTTTNESTKITPQSNYKKRRSHSRSSERSKSRSPSPRKTSKDNKSIHKEKIDNLLTDDQMNELGAKLVKAEIMGNDELAKELQVKLEKAREVRAKMKDSVKANLSTNRRLTKGRTETSSKEEEHILLTSTNSRGMTRPFASSSSSRQPHFQQSDLYGGRKANKKRKVETHVSGERIRYFPDDDKYDIKQMFEKEKYTTGADSDAQFIQIAGKHKNPKDDLEDIFADKVRESISEYDQEEKEKKRAIAEHERFTKILESCDKCFDSSKMEKNLMIAMGNNVYLAIPHHQGLLSNHCLIIPMQHITCSTQLDEDTWTEINDFRKALTQMFASKSQEVIFFEIANYLHKKPHMVIHCIPSEKFEMAPMYFKKAIQESEYEWSINKQLVTLKEKDLRRSIPKGLPYFWVHFGMNLGFAHVIEDQHKFKPNFAQEIIGEMLDIDHRRWRKPREERNIVEKVKRLAEMWKPFDCTS